MDNRREYTPEELAGMIQGRGIRPSAQRIAVLAAVANVRKHPSAEELYTRLSKVFHTLSRTTIYNSLKILTENGMLRELEIESGCTRYDLALQPEHGHFICRKCTRIFDIPLPPGMTEVQAPMFHIDAVEITYRGLCPECRQTENQQLK